MPVCIYDYVFPIPLHCPGPGYWLLSRPVVPPPQSDHWKQLLSGETTHPIRHKKGHRIIHVSHTKVNLYIHTYILREIFINWTKNLDRTIPYNLRC